MSFHRFVRPAALAAMLAVLSASVPAPSTADFPPYTKVLTIAVVAPLSGDERQAGIDMSNGVTLAIDEANDARGLTDFGWQAQSFDDQGDPGIAMQEAQFALVDPTTTFIIGHIGADETNFALQTYHEQEVPVIVPTQPYYGLTQHGYDDVFRLCATDIDEGIAAAKFADRTLKATKVAIVYVKDEFGVDAGQGFQTYATAVSKMSTSGFGIDVDSKSDKDIVAQVKAYAPDALFMSGGGSYLAKVLADIRATGVTAPAVASDGFYDLGSVKKAGSAAEGMVVTTCIPPLQLMPSAQPFVHHYQAQFGQPSAYSLYGYAAAQLAIAAATQGHTGDRRLLDRLLSIGTYETVLGPVSFQKNGDPFQPILYFYTVTNGALVYTSSSIPNPLVVSK
ncbi:MAG TPA: branched-chain amino acid ABC transporter substrate-binding protein [Candidatus Eremiobacteraceae bacterium]|nr:branched-chain amino acid ABC transporter substrate-binding protein [Candidatus Eremiobacteraceae bacterium]